MRSSEAINRKKAIAGYRKALEREPGNDMVRLRLGDLLAQSEQLAEARDKLLDAARGFEKRGFEDKALATYSLAVARMPFDEELVTLLVDKHLARRHVAQAIQILLDARARLRGTPERPQAIRLLRRVLEIAPAHTSATLDLAWLLARAGHAPEARRMLERLAEGQAKRTMLLRIRGALFRLSPSPGTAWGWLRALFLGR